MDENNENIEKRWDKKYEEKQDEIYEANLKGQIDTKLNRYKDAVTDKERKSILEEIASLCESLEKVHSEYYDELTYINTLGKLAEINDRIRAREEIAPIAEAEEEFGIPGEREFEEKADGSIEIHYNDGRDIDE